MTGSEEPSSENDAARREQIARRIEELERQINEIERRLDEALPDEGPDAGLGEEPNEPAGPEESGHAGSPDKE